MMNAMYIAYTTTIITTSCHVVSCHLYLISFSHVNIMSLLRYIDITLTSDYSMQVLVVVVVASPVRTRSRSSSEEPHSCKHRRTATLKRHQLQPNTQQLTQR